MFGFLKNNSNIMSPQTGTAVNLSEVPDPAFSEKMLGDGFAVIPVDGTIYSPVSGTVADVTESKHAYTITTDDGLDILIHIGIDTVELKGEGFEPLVKSGDEVKQGQPIAKADLTLIKDKGFNVITPVIIANIDDVKDFSIETGHVTGGETVVMTYKI